MKSAVFQGLALAVFLPFPPLLSAAPTDELHTWGAERTPQTHLRPATSSSVRGQFLVVQDNGALAGWGSNSSGEAAPLSGTNFRSVFAGPDYSYAIRDDGSAIGWGVAAFGSLASRAGPYTQIAPGAFVAYGLRKDHTLEQWGLSLGPLFNAPAGADFVALTGSSTHFLALRADGTIVCWGSNFRGQATAPVGNDFKAIAAAEEVSFALRNDGRIVAWGSDDYGQVSGIPTGGGHRAVAAGDFHGLALQADGSLVAWGLPNPAVLTVPPGNDFKAIRAGGQNSLAVREDGSVVAWGATNTNSPPPFTGYLALAAGPNHTVALLADHSLRAWGTNASGEVDVPAGNTFIAVAVGNEHSLALRSDGTLAAWGANGRGQTNAPTDNGFVKIAAAGDYCVALRDDGTLVAWGHDNVNQASPPPGDTYTAIAAGPQHALALTEDGTLVAWGNNTSGEASPPAGTGFTAIAAGGSHSLALRADGSIAAWGSASHGQSTPPVGTGYTALAAGSQSSFALTGAGAIQAWGGETAPGNRMYPPTGGGFTTIVASPQGTRAHALRTAGAPPPPPVPFITSPENSTASGSTIEVEVSLRGDLVGLDRVELYIDDGVFPTVTVGGDGWVEAVPRQIVVLDQSDYAENTLVLRVRAVSGDAAFADSAPVIAYFGLEDCVLDVWAFLLRHFAVEVEPEDPPGPTSVGTRSRDTVQPEIGRGKPGKPRIAALDLDLFRRFRDEILADTPAGRYFTDLYATNSMVFVQAIISDPELITDINQALTDWTPFVTAVVNGQGDSVVVTPALAIQAQTLFARVRAAASPELGTAMASEVAALDVATWSGLTGTQLLGRVETQVRPAPTIATHPAAQAVTAGGGATLQVAVAAGSAGPLTYQWYLDGVAIPGATGASLPIPSAQAFHAGSYSVTVGNPFGAAPSDPAVFTVNAAPASGARLMNLSTRALCLTGDNVLIPGFVIAGTGTKQILVRGVGPALAGYGVTGTLTDPRLALKRRVGDTWEDVVVNDNWAESVQAAALEDAAVRTGAFALGAGSLDAAALADLAPGVYSVVNDDSAGGSGVALVEIYDADDSGAPGTAQLTNISTRGYIGVGGEVAIAGFVVSSEGPKTFLVRAIGPGLAGFGLGGLLTDPSITVFRRVGGVDEPILTNDTWGENGDTVGVEDAAALVGAFPLTRGSADAAFVITLPPGVYTVVATGVGGSTGTALVEIYVVN